MIAAAIMYLGVCVIVGCGNIASAIRGLKK